MHTIYVRRRFGLVVIKNLFLQTVMAKIYSLEFKGNWIRSGNVNICFTEILTVIANVLYLEGRLDTWTLSLFSPNFLRY